MDASRLAIRSLSHDDAVVHDEAAEHDPLLGSSSSAAHPERVKKPWYRPRPLWLVPFAVTAALCRSMTLAPRTEVFTQLACEGLRQSHHHHTSSQHDYLVSALPTNADILFSRTRLAGFSDVDSLLFVQDAARYIRYRDEDSSPSGEDQTGEDSPIDITHPPPVDCLKDPAVQADAAKLQTIMTTTMGILSALTTGWWGQFGDRHGRTKVIACAIAGLLFTDIVFIIASNPPEALRGHSRKLLIIAPVVEGLLGGWSTMQGATYAYISDCTSDGSRAHVFSRFSGVFFTGIAFGPEIAALILRATHNATIVFYTSASCAFINLLLLLFVFPESLSNDVRARNIAAANEAKNKLRDAQVDRTIGLWRSIKNTTVSFVKPLRILGPQPKTQGRGQDWSMTMIAIVLFCHYLTLGVFQIKYLYAEHAFSWDAEELSYYITAMGSTRAVHLLIILPTIIRLCKPVSTSKAKSKTSKGKAVPSPVELCSEVKFDLLVAKFSLGLDLISQVLVPFAKDTSPIMFVGVTAISGFGTGLVPALQSVAMSTMLLRRDGEDQAGDKGGAEVGKLFGAIAVIQAVGSMILGPMLFGTLYSLSVAKYPEAIFVVAAALLFVGAVLLLLIRRPRAEVPIQIRVDTRVEVAVERRVRGRSRKSKDITGGSLAH